MNNYTYRSVYRSFDVKETVCTIMFELSFTFVTFQIDMDQLGYYTCEVHVLLTVNFSKDALYIIICCNKYDRGMTIFKRVTFIQIKFSTKKELGNHKNHADKTNMSLRSMTLRLRMSSLVIILLYFQARIVNIVNFWIW